jgi:hypothetical protein
MDADASELVEGAAAALIEAMVADAWEAAAAAVGRVLNQDDPEWADSVVRDLRATRTEILNQPPRRRGVAMVEAASAWSARLGSSLDQGIVTGRQLRNLQAELRQIGGGVRGFGTTRVISPEPRHEEGYSGDVAAPAGSPPGTTFGDEERARETFRSPPGTSFGDRDD